MTETSPPYRGSSDSRILIVSHKPIMIPHKPIMIAAAAPLCDRPPDLHRQTHDHELPLPYQYGPFWRCRLLLSAGGEAAAHDRGLFGYGKPQDIV
jgi:hypothetical protein